MKNYEWIGEERDLPRVGRVRAGSVVPIPGDMVDSLKKQKLIADVTEKSVEEKEDKRK